MNFKHASTGVLFLLLLSFSLNSVGVSPQLLETDLQAYFEVIPDVVISPFKDSETKKVNLVLVNPSKQPVVIYDLKLNPEISGCNLHVFERSTTVDEILPIHCEFTDDSFGGNAGGYYLPAIYSLWDGEQLTIPLEFTFGTPLAESLPSQKIEVEMKYASVSQFATTSERRINDLIQSAFTLDKTQRKFGELLKASFSLKIFKKEREKFQAKLKGGNFCFTGEAAVPNILFNWDWKAIHSESTCGAEGADRNYFCDPTQITVGVMQRLQQIRVLGEELQLVNDQEERDKIIQQITGLRHVQVALLADNYLSKDFLNDFVDHYRFAVFADAPPYFTEADGGLHLYISKEKFGFSVPDEDLDNDRQVILPGKYNLFLEFNEGDPDFDYKFFDPQGNPLVTVDVQLSSHELVQEITPFHYLSLNGLLGTTQEYNRDDYGAIFAKTPFTLTNDPPFHVDDSTLLISQSGSSFQRTFVAIIEPVTGSRVLTSKELEPSIFEFKLTQSAALPVLMGAKANNDWDWLSFYNWRNQDGAKVSPLSTSWNLKYATSCPTEAVTKRDSAATNRFIDLVDNPADLEEARGLERIRVRPNQTVVYAGVFYTAVGSEDSIIAQTVFDSGMGILGSISEAGVVQLQRTENRIETLEDIITNIRNKKICVKQNAFDDSWEYTWNEYQLSKELVGAESRLSHELGVNLTALRCPNVD